jgi:hypothetical protein
MMLSDPPKFPDEEGSRKKPRVRLDNVGHFHEEASPKTS